MHAGVDIGSSKSSRDDEPVYAAKGGVVYLVAENSPSSNMSGYGNAVVIQHGGAGQGLYSLYAHLKDGSVRVRPGQTIDGGAMLGLMGNTTNGQFSPLPGQSIDQWRAQARARGYNARGPMVRHLHLEVRRALPDGRSPFPGPYPQSPAQALYNVDPGPWLRELGLIYSTRGATTIAPGSAVDRSRAQWQAMGQYEPVAFDRGVRFGLTPSETAALVATSVAAALLLVLIARQH